MMTTLDQTKVMPGWQFAVFRIVFGLYLAIHFVMLVPFSGELFGAGGVIADPGMNPTAGLFPTPFALPMSDGLCATLIGCLVVCSLLFAGGVGRSCTAAVLWFGWTALFHRNNLIANPSIPYVGLLLLLCALVPKGEPLSRSNSVKKWAMPRWVWRCAWILLAVGYSFSGWTKLSSPSWVDGSAMRFLIENPLARDGWMRDLMLWFPGWVLIGMTWLTLLAELLFLPLAMWKKSRPWMWLLLVGMHFGIIAVVDFADLSLGMLMIHFFTFDPDWLSVRKKEKVVMAYDGDCLMCSGFIRFLAEEDRERVLRFTSLQGERGRLLEEEAGVMALSSVVVLSGKDVLVRSSAVIVVLNALGGMWRVVAWISKLVPVVWRDQVYDAVARRRSRQSDVCGLPSGEVRARLLD